MILLDKFFLLNISRDGKLIEGALVDVLLKHDHLINLLSFSYVKQLFSMSAGE